MTSRRTVLALAAMAAAVFAGCFAIVPLYDMLCNRVDIRAGAARTAAPAATVATARLVTVRFDANVADGLPWEFEPVVPRMDVRTGAVSEARFRVRNRGAHATVGQAVPSILPAQAAGFLNKSACFCFQQQELAAGESKELPVRFVVASGLPGEIESITLSYTFMRRPPQAGAAKGAERNS